VEEEYRYPTSLASLPVIQEVRKPPVSETHEHPSEPEAAAEAAEPQKASDARLATNDPTRFVHKKLIEGKVIEALKQVYDPEIPVNIYELGLIYEIDVRDDDTVHVKMTLTAPACPVAGSLPGQVEQQVESVPEVKSATVELVWDPPWSRDRMSEAALLQLGMY
jgi:FeS assembly SUF system protein